MTEQVRDDMRGRSMVLGVDRLDYTKGLPEKLRAICGRCGISRLAPQVCLLQVVVPSREDIPKYLTLREIERLVSEINGQYTDASWVPIHFIYRHLDRKQLVAYYQAAEVGLVTPLKDGMNLVAKEYCASQVHDTGVLVLSEFAGAAAQLRCGALLVNPNDVTGVTTAIHDALFMSSKERKRRMKQLRRSVREYDVRRWTDSFLDAAGIELTLENGGTGRGC